jgi:16S rRNA (guanine966-N2)-methyltransferase
MRVVGGEFRGRALIGPDDDRIRPTSDRVREAMFNILIAGAPALDPEGLPVIDLFAGTGALGIEALSRGASYGLFIEEDAEARGLIRRNIDGLGLGGKTRIFRRDATDLGPCAHKGAFALAFLDPPYGKGLATRGLAALVDGGWLQDQAVVVIEERADAPLVLPAGLIEIDRRIWGETLAVFARYAATSA